MFGSTYHTNYFAHMRGGWEHRKVSRIKSQENKELGGKEKATGIRGNELIFQVQKWMRKEFKGKNTFGNQ